jgi:hypothetical protein
MLLKLNMALFIPSLPLLESVMAPVKVLAVLLNRYCDQKEPLVAVTPPDPVTAPPNLRSPREDDETVNVAPLVIVIAPVPKLAIKLLLGIVIVELPLTVIGTVDPPVLLAPPMLLTSSMESEPALSTTPPEKLLAVELRVSVPEPFFTSVTVTPLLLMGALMVMAPAPALT